MMKHSIVTDTSTKGIHFLEIPDAQLSNPGNLNGPLPEEPHIIITVSGALKGQAA